nr:serine hydrolase [Acidobacteriota bacterium]
MIALALLLCSCRSTTDAVVRGATGARLDETLTRLVPFGLSGTVLVADRDGVVLHKGYGFADAAHRTPNRPDTIYDMGSITKAFTATAIALLEHDGKLAYTDTLPKYFDGVPEDKRAITVHQLLTHTAGLVDLTGGDYDKVSREQLVADVFRAPLVSAPGAAWNYSNAGFSLLAAIIEKVSGKTYEAFMHERIYDPAGMRHTGYALPPRVAHRVAHTYTPPVDHGTPLDRLTRSGGAHWVLLGNGGLLTTASDLYRFELALREARIVPREVQQTLFTPRFEDHGETQAYGWFVEAHDGRRAIMHGGDAPELGVNADFRHAEDHSLFLTFLGNTRLNGLSPRRGVVPIVDRIARGEQVDVVKVVPSTPRSLAAYAGTYSLPDGATIDIRVEHDHLVAGMTGQSAIDLFTLQRSENSLAARKKLNERAQKVIETFDWNTAAARYGKFLKATLLGTARRDRGAFLTSIRARFDRGEKVLRFSWEDGKPVTESDDGALPRLDFFSESPIRFALERPLWLEHDTTFVFFDLYTAQT